MYGTDSLTGGPLSVRVALPTAAELQRAAESTGKPIELHAVATLPPGEVETTTTAEDADTGRDADLRLERIHDTLGRLTLLDYSAAQAKDDEQRLRIFREMHEAAVPLAGEIEPLCCDAPPEHMTPPAITRAVALRFLSPVGKNSAGRWHEELFSAAAAETYVSAMARVGSTVRPYDVELDLDRGTVKVTPQHGWRDDSRKAVAEIDTEVDDESSADADMDDDAPCGDASTYYGFAMFQRSENQWTVHVTEIDRGAEPQLAAACPTLDAAWKYAEQWRNTHGDQAEDWAMILVGPGSGPVDIRNITLWPDQWTVRAAERFIPNRESGLEGAPLSSQDARRLAEMMAASVNGQPTACPVITVPYLAESKGGAR